MLKIKTDKQTVQKALAKVQEALSNKNKEKQESKEKTDINRQ